MFRRVRGRAVIINNENFVQSTHRAGCQEDVKDLQTLFDAIHFDVVLHQDQTAQVVCLLILLLFIIYYYLYPR